MLLVASIALCGERLRSGQPDGFPGVGLYLVFDRHGTAAQVYAPGPPARLRRSHRTCGRGIRRAGRATPGRAGPLLGDGGAQELSHPRHRGPSIRHGAQRGREAHPAERQGEREADVRDEPLHLLQQSRPRKLAIRPRQLRHKSAQSSPIRGPSTTVSRGPRVSTTGRPPSTRSWAAISGR